MEKTLGNTDVNGTKKNVPDVIVFGDGDMFKLLCKASSQQQGWMKSTKAKEIPGVGAILQVTTQQKNPDGSYSLAEAVTFVPGVEIKTTRDDAGNIIARCLVAIGTNAEHEEINHIRKKLLTQGKMESIS